MGFGFRCGCVCRGVLRGERRLGGWVGGWVGCIGWGDARVGASCVGGWACWACGCGEWASEWSLWRALCLRGCPTCSCGPWLQPRPPYTALMSAAVCVCVFLWQMDVSPRCSAHSHTTKCSVAAAGPHTAAGCYRWRRRDQAAPLVCGHQLGADPQPDAALHPQEGGGAGGAGSTG